MEYRNLCASCCPPTSVTPHWAKTKANSEVNIIKNFSERQVMLVVGASGIVGRAALELFDQLPGWGAIGISRRVPDLPKVQSDMFDIRKVRHTT